MLSQPERLCFTDKKQSANTSLTSSSLCAVSSVRRKERLRQMASKLQNIERSDIERSEDPPPTNFTARAKVVEVHDGDTCDLVFRKKRRLMRYKCRLAGIDTPEISEGQKAQKARDFLVWLSIGNDAEDFNRRKKPYDKDTIQDMLDQSQNIVNAEFGDVGYYGRPLVTLSNGTGGPTFNDQLISSGYASVYQR